MRRINRCGRHEQKTAGAISSAGLRQRRNKGFVGGKGSLIAADHTGQVQDDRTQRPVGRRVRQNIPLNMRVLVAPDRMKPQARHRRGAARRQQKPPQPSARTGDDQVDPVQSYPQKSAGQRLTPCVR